MYIYPNYSSSNTTFPAAIEISTSDFSSHRSPFMAFSYRFPKFPLDSTTFNPSPRIITNPADVDPSTFPSHSLGYKQCTFPICVRCAEVIWFRCFKGDKRSTRIELELVSVCTLPIVDWNFL